MPISLERVVARGLDLGLAQTELERAEGDVVEDRGAEQLDVRVLEDEADLAMEAEGILAGGDRGDITAQVPASRLRSGR